jgi:hypothetical protein
MKDLTISLTDQPGSLAALGEAAGRANINIEGACAYVEDGRALAHICVADADGARRALQESGLEVTGEQDVIVVQLEDRPGVLGGVARRIADAGVTSRSRTSPPEHGSSSVPTTSTERTMAAMAALGVRSGSLLFARPDPKPLQTGGFSERERTGANVRQHLPCRRSWVRVPSSALEKPRSGGVFCCLRLRAGRCGKRDRLVAAHCCPFNRLIEGLTVRLRHPVAAL